MSYDLELTQGDFGVSFGVDLTLPDGTDVSFDSGDTGKLRVRQKGVANPVVIEYDMNLLLNGKRATYTFQSGETNVPGRFEMEVEITFSPTYVLTWPHPRFPKFSMLVKEALG